MTWSLASYTANGATGFGVLREDGTLVAPADLKRWSSTLNLLEDWPAAEAVLRELDTQSAPVISYDALLPPLRWPRKVICAGSPTPSSRTATATTPGKRTSPTWPATPSTGSSAWQDMPMEGEVQITGLGGAIGDVAEPDTAFSNRGDLLWLNFAMRWDDPADDPDYIARTRAIVADLAPLGRPRHLRQHAQLRRAGPRGRSPRRPGEIRRASQAQGPYDPQNLFRMNANIPPAR
jgi:hypothetical protein